MESQHWKSFLNTNNLGFMTWLLSLTLIIFTCQQFTKLAKLLHDKANLPIARYQDMIVDAVRANQTVIVAGDTGCGKSTQVSSGLNVLIVINDWKSWWVQRNYIRVIHRSYSALCTCTPDCHLKVLIQVQVFRDKFELWDPLIKHIMVLPFLYTDKLCILMLLIVQDSSRPLISEHTRWSSS